MQLTPTELTSFHGGMNRKVNPLLIKLEEARIAKNVDLSEIGSIKKAKGYAAYLNAPADETVLAMYPFYKIGASISRYFLRDSGGKVYKNGESAWEALDGATGLNTSAVADWLTYRNLSIRFNGVDAPKKFDGTTFGNLGGLTSSDNAYKASIATLYKDRVYVTGASPNYSTVYFSEIGDPEKWPAFNNFDVNNNDGDRNMAVVPIYDSLVIFKEFSMWEYQVDAKNNPSVLRYITLDVGTTSRRSIVNIGGIVYFFSRKGIYQFASRYPELISLKVQDFIDAITDPYAVVGFKDGYKYCLYIGDVTVAGKAYNKCVLVYDTLQDQWVIRTLAHAVKCVSQFIVNNIEKTYFGSTAGKTFEWGTGYSYAGTEIEVEYETGLIQLGDPNIEKELQRIVLRTAASPKSTPTIHYSVDGEQFKEIKQSITQAVQRFDIGDRDRLRDIALRFHEISKTEMKEIYQAIIYTAIKGGERVKGEK